MTTTVHNPAGQLHDRYQSEAAALRRAARTLRITARTPGAHDCTPRQQDTAAMIALAHLRRGIA